jgi:lipoyl(octanoyl) transferase
MANVIIKDLGKIDFSEAWQIQKDIFNQILHTKTYNLELPVCEQNINYNYLLFCEHPHVYTMGKSGSDKNLLADTDFLKSKGAGFFRIDRGGDITYHGPGQIVVYPVFDLEEFGIGIKEYIYNLEEVVIITLREFSVEAGRLKSATGVWIDPENQVKARKICAIGVKTSRFVTMHGFAFNINTHLEFYQYINPCGFTDKGVTSMQKETGILMKMDAVKKALIRNFARVFSFEPENYE